MAASFVELDLRHSSAMKGPDDDRPHMLRRHQFELDAAASTIEKRAKQLGKTWVWTVADMEITARTLKQQGLAAIVQSIREPGSVVSIVEIPTVYEHQKVRACLRGDRPVPVIIQESETTVLHPTRISGVYMRINRRAGRFAGSDIVAYAPKISTPVVQLTA